MGNRPTEVQIIQAVDHINCSRVGAFVWNEGAAEGGKSKGSRFHLACIFQNKRSIIPLVSRVSTTNSASTNRSTHGNTNRTGQDWNALNRGQVKELWTRPIGAFVLILKRFWLFWIAIEWWGKGWKQQRLDCEEDSWRGNKEQAVTGWLRQSVIGSQRQPSRQEGWVAAKGKNIRAGTSSLGGKGTTIGETHKGVELVFVGVGDGIVGCSRTKLECRDMA